jgi:4'-phosphopantetheinyl transferase
MTVGRPTEVEIWWSTLAAADRSLLDLLDGTERARVAALQRPADQGRSLVAAALLRVVVGDHLRVPPGEVRIDRTCGDCGGPHGRPRVLAPGETAPHVSVSHSGLLVVVALTRATPVGVDVERVPDGEAAPAVPGADVPDVATWVRREAMLKVAGDGPLVVRSLRPPLPGYVAAVATSADGSPAEVEVQVRTWPAEAPS